MCRQFGLIGSITMILLGVAARDVYGCYCKSIGQPCQAYFQVDAVFIGTVESIAVRKTTFDAIPDGLIDGRVVHVAVDWISRGAQGPTVDLWTGMGGGDCGFDFKVGSRYVIYALHRADGSLSTGICSRTRLVSEAADDLAYLASVPASTTGARLSGTIKHTEHDYADGKTIEHGGVADAQVVARSTGGVFGGMTDEQGRYAIAGLPVGSYDVEVLPPWGYSTTYLHAKFDMKDPRACRVEDFALHYAGHVTGTIVDASGRPVADLRVEIAPEHALEQPLQSWSVTAGPWKTDTFGRFEITDIPPGRFVVGVGLTAVVDQPVIYARTLYPAVEASAGSAADLGTLTLPVPLRKYVLQGTAVDAGGAPVADASIVLFGPRFQQLTLDVKTGADGTFTVNVFEGQSIRVHGFIDVSMNPLRQANGEQALTVSGPPEPIRLVLVVR